MVAIKSAPERLYDRDIWPGLPWRWGDELKIRDMLREELIAQGITEHPQLYFAEGRAWERYMQQFPKYSERQKIMKRLYPHVQTAWGLSLTKEEAEYLLEKLHGVNDPLGQSIKEKIKLTLGTK